MATRKRVKQEPGETDANNNNNNGKHIFFHALIGLNQFGMELEDELGKATRRGRTEEEEAKEWGWLYSIVATPYFVFKDGTVRIKRSFAPAHFTLEMKNFSVISSSKIGKYDSSEFEVAGYKWRISIHPNGNKEKNVDGHISLYLSIVEEGNVPMFKFGWEVKATFKLFIYDHIRDNYLTIKDDCEEPKCFHRMKTEHGFDNFLSLGTLKDPSSGYLRQDSCVFGAEVFVKQQPNGKGECLLTTSLSTNNTYAIKIKYSTVVPQEYWYSEEFLIGKCNWKLLVYPQGNGPAKGKQISIYLSLANSRKVPAVRKVYAEYKFRMIDQLNNARSVETSCQSFFMDGKSFGLSNFMSLENLRSKANGYIVNDSMIVEVEITLLSVSTDYC